MTPEQPKSPFPAIAPMGIDGLLVRFADKLSESANREALGFRSALAQDPLAGVEEVAAALASVYLRFDPAKSSYETLHAALEIRLKQVWGSTWKTPARRWHIPTVYGGEHGPQLAEVAALAGMSEQAAIAQISATPLRVMSLGFAPGQPYLGLLPKAFDLPRQSSLSKEVPAGALTLAIRQCVLFASPAPTGWRYIGQTRFKAFHPESDTPFPLRPGDELVFFPVSIDDLSRLPPRMEPAP
ncbi:MAG: allophanate hydrolase subunit 1 [Rhodobacteraceae bacterium]|nr:allophanate hydrolase subunit 1 [Paracoccaceae bacterium]